MPTAEVLDRGPASGLEGLQDSLGSCRVPENSLFTAHRKSGSWSSTQGSCSEESHCLWTARRNENQNQNEQLEEISVTACSQFDYFITSDECNCQTGGGKKNWHEDVRKWNAPPKLGQTIRPFLFTGLVSQVMTANRAQLPSSISSSESHTSEPQCCKLQDLLHGLCSFIYTIYA